MLENRNLSLAERRELRLAALAEKASRDADLLRLHQFAADVLGTDEGPVVCAQALAHVEIWARDSLCSRKYIVAWRKMLRMTPSAFRAEILREGDEGVALRQNTPFGFLRERMLWQ
ncbi:hypothetical protein AGMMS50225_24660 [Betaproteobacteria bacterium]|nr:hypothetical protein AGMMS50225_24660 [Betaproteobacteria bacterium]